MQNCDKSIQIIPQPDEVWVDWLGKEWEILAVSSVEGKFPMEYLQTPPDFDVNDLSEYRTIHAYDLEHEIFLFDGEFNQVIDKYVMYLEPYTSTVWGRLLSDFMGEEYIDGQVRSQFTKVK